MSMDLSGPKLICEDCKEELRWYEFYRVQGVGKNTQYADLYICDNDNCNVQWVHLNENGQKRYDRLMIGVIKND